MSVHLPAEQAPTLRTASLGKAYAPGQFVVRDISLDIHRHDFVAIIGQSGAGKSTLLRCLNLLIRPTEGRVFLSGTDVTHASGKQLREVRGRVGMIFQGFNLVRRLSVLDNVLAGRLRFRRGPVELIGGLIRHHPPHERDAAMACLARVRIEHLAHRRADSLSGGQQQRVAIARVLAQEPDVILADEPIASLDPQSAQGVMTALREIHETRRIPVVVNLHQVDIARQFASRIIGVAQGRIRLDAPTDSASERDISLIYGGSAAPPEWKSGLHIDTGFESSVEAAAGAHA